jgi:hypothetical protein
MAQAQQALRRDRAGGGIDGFVVVERLGVARAPVAELAQAGAPSSQ